MDEKHITLIVELNKAGRPGQYIADLLGVSREYIRQLVARRGETLVSPTYFLQQHLALAAKANAEPLTIAEIAELFGVSPGTASKYIQEWRESAGIITNTSGRDSINFRIDDEVRAIIEQRAKATGWTMSAIAREALRKGLEQ
jgi:transcriptional regulator with XRE-family HTH domain